MQGSPILLSAPYQENQVNVRVPLEDGNFMYLLPDHGMQIEDIPYMDTEIVIQLNIIKGYIKRIMSEVEV